MKLIDFDYNLPNELIAVQPASPRDHSRLLVLDRQSGELNDKKFYNIIEYLNKGDVLVLNDSKVIPARLKGKKESGGKVEVFLHKKETQGDSINLWQCLIGGKGIKVNQKILFDGKLEAKIINNNQDGTWAIEFNLIGKDFNDEIERIGEVPIPPYISKQLIRQISGNKIKQSDKIDYQTVYADDKKKGSVAAPTAGLHFTRELLQKIKEKGVLIKYITLHVGLGTFAPVKTENIEDHKMHAEFVEVSAETVDQINTAKQNGKKIITVGTTSTRTLEFLYQRAENRYLEPKNYNYEVDIFIYPGYEFKIVDAMITNFHLPKSTLLMLVSAFATKVNIDKAYQYAIKNKYRFYSYGDAVLIK